MKKALIDASSAILLAKAGLFFKISEFYDLRMVPDVYWEVTQKKEQSHVRLFSQSLAKGRIRLVSVLQPDVARQINNS
ncbi:MAG: hypothetical protein PVI90_08535, partial [Desulfobacteraceae bacterium]